MTRRNLKSKYGEVNKFVNLLGANSKNTQRRYICDAEQMLDFTQNELGKKFDELVPDDMISWWGHISNGTYKYSPNALRAKVNSLKMFCRKMQRLDLLEDLLKTGIIDPPKKPKLITRRLNDDEVERLLGACRGNVYFEAVIRLLLDAGLREEEASNLNLDSIDFENKKITIYSGKGSKDRESWIDYDETIDTIKEYIQHGRMVPKKYGKNGKPKKDYEQDLNSLFITRQGTRPDVQTIYDIVRNTGCDAGLDNPTMGHVTPHCLRRTCARTLYLNRVPAEVIQIKLGHARLETTMDYIGDISDIAQQRCREYLEKNLNNKISENILS